MDPVKRVKHVKVRTRVTFCAALLTMGTERVDGKSSADQAVLGIRHKDSLWNAVVVNYTMS